LTGSGTTITSEQVWDDQQGGGGATGGGVSAVFPLPTWQANARVPAGPSSTGGRGVPDVAGDAAPATGYNVLVDGTPQTVGGTSAVAPLWAGLLAIVNQQRAAAGAKPAGFINPLLYATPSVCHDVTVGNNGAFKAGPGWDACTGLGSPNGVAVATALGAMSTVSGGTDPAPAPPPRHKKHPKHTLA
jgi:kumamolisin